MSENALLAEGAQRLSMTAAQLEGELSTARKAMRSASQTSLAEAASSKASDTGAETQLTLQLFVSELR
jgi:hypothetical protein